MNTLCRLLLLFLLSVTGPAQAEKITIAAAADLKFALNEIVNAFKQTRPTDEVDVVYGSSGKFHTQLQQGAPYDLFFSADIAFPRGLWNAGLAGSPVTPYAFGRIVLWSATSDVRTLTLKNLEDTAFRRIAIANPKHAPYGKRAEEALRAVGLWEKVEPKLVYGENVSHAAQFVQTGNAQVGIIALALALNPELGGRGSYSLIPDNLHAPIEQGFIVTRRAQANALAHAFAKYMTSPPAKAVMTRYGFTLPGDASR